MPALRAQHWLLVAAAVATCGTISSSPAQQPLPDRAGVLALEPYNPKFVVDGLALGGSVYPESAIYKAYKCRASDDFTGFTWCASSHETGQFRTVHLVGDDPPYQRQQSRLPHASDRSGILPTGRR